MMRSIYIIVLIIESIAITYGIYCEVAPTSWPFQKLPDGMGLAIMLIGVVMAPIALDRYHDHVAAQKASKVENLLKQSAGKALACHEKEFYHNWIAQFESARDSIDITHLGVRPPNDFIRSEKEYFKRFKSLVKSSNANIRRVERLTSTKEEWIKKLLDQIEGVKNFSQAVYKDPLGETENPAAVSVCRIDNSVAWLIALAEHQSTIGVRDLMITDPESVGLVGRYFQKRLWDRSTVVMSMGQARNEEISKIFT